MNDNYLPEFTPAPEPTASEPIVDREADPLVSKASADEGAITVAIHDTMEDEETGEANPNFIYSDEEVEEEQEVLPVKQKKKLRNDEVFNTPQVIPVADPVKPPKKKRVATEKQLNALKKARETTRLRREAAKKAKEEGLPPPPKKLSKKQQMKLDESKKQETTIHREVLRSQVSFSEAQVAKITADAIDKYEAKRKVRKLEKAKIKEAEAHEARTRQTLQRAMGRPDPNDIWSHALSGMI